MTVDSKKVGVCVICGDEFSRERVSRRTCSGKCRTKLSRKNNADKRNLSKAYASAIASIELLKTLIDGDLQHEAYLNINDLRITLVNVLPSSDSLWHCENCKSVRKVRVPSSFSCSCDNPRWVLQKKMI